jgi:hypothetical protein
MQHYKEKATVEKKWELFRYADWEVWLRKETQNWWQYNRQRVPVKRKISFCLTYIMTCNERKMNCISALSITWGTSCTGKEIPDAKRHYTNLCRNQPILALCHLGPKSIIALQVFVLPSYVIWRCKVWDEEEILQVCALAAEPRTPQFFIRKGE